MMSSKRALVAFVSALAIADLLYRLLPPVAFAGIVAVALIVAVLAKLSILGVTPSPAYEIVIGLALGTVVSGALKYLFFHAFS